MSEYKIGRIYKIIHNQSNIIYVGSTFNTLRDRMSSHKTNFKKWIDNKNNQKCAIFTYFEKYEIKNFKIILIKEYEVIDRTHLKAYEQLWISKLKSININNSFNLLRKFTKKQSDKDYYINNIDKIKESNKKYYINNIDKIKESNKKYRDENKKYQKEYQKEYGKIKYNCECGSNIRKADLSKHLKTLKHNKFINKF